jgi:hypothetical protein
VDPQDRIDEMLQLVETARSMPMSRNCIVDRGEMIAVLEQLRTELPTELRRAGALLEERDKIIDAGKREAGRIIAEARAEAQRLRDEVDDYVDTALANFEQFLTRSLASIERGRDKMHALREIGSFQSTTGDEDRPLPF